MSNTITLGPFSGMNTVVKDHAMTTDKSKRTSVAGNANVQRKHAGHRPALVRDGGF
jgi:hypothetical protein